MFHKAWYRFMAFCISSGERLSSHLTPRQITRYSAVVVCVLIGFFMVAGSLSSKYTTNETERSGRL